MRSTLFTDMIQAWGIAVHTTYLHVYKVSTFIT